MKAKPKLIICSIIFLVGGFFNVFFSTALHGVLSRTMERLSFVPFSDCISSILSNRQHLLLFACLQGVVVLLAVMYFLANLKPYQSDLDIITPQISTPKAVGQYQHGSSRWLTEPEKDKVFTSYVLDPSDPQIKELLKSGYDGLDFMKR